MRLRARGSISSARDDNDLQESLALLAIASAVRSQSTLTFLPLMSRYRTSRDTEIGRAARLTVLFGPAAEPWVSCSSYFGYEEPHAMVLLDAKDR
jgi:hypothetical protein